MLPHDTAPLEHAVTLAEEIGGAGSSRRWRLWSKVESTISVIFVFLADFAVLVLGWNILFVVADAGEEGVLYLRAVWVGLVVLEGVFLLWLKHSLEAGLHPVAPEMALRQIRWPVLLRPVVFLWWGAHFLMAAAAGAALVYSQRDDSIVLWAQVAVRFLNFTAVYSANLFLLLAVTSLWRNRQLVGILWRWRLLVDAVITVGGWYAVQILRAWGLEA